MLDYLFWGIIIFNVLFWCWVLFHIVKCRNKTTCNKKRCTYYEFCRHTTFARRIEIVEAILKQRAREKE